MWKPRLRISSRVLHSSTTPPPERFCAWNEDSCTAVGAAIAVIVVEKLLVKFGSLVLEVTIAVLVAKVDELNIAALALIVTRTKPPTGIVPILQLTVPAACEQVP